MRVNVISNFLWILYRGITISFLCFVGVCFVNGDSIRLMAVTSTPFGAAQEGASFSCLLSGSQNLDAISTRRLVMRGSSSPYNTLEMPLGSIYSTDTALNSFTVDLPNTLEGQGVFYCTAEGVATRVPITLLHYDRRFDPTDGQFTITVNVGESVDLSITRRGQIPSKLQVSRDLRWEKQGATTAEFETFYDSSSTTFSIDPVTLDDAGVYAIHWRTKRPEFRFGLVRLIVRECATGRWGAPDCKGICDNCYNGGICDDKTGKCVCRPGFMGPNCLTACGENTFGYDCEHECGPGQTVESCSVSMFCVEDPVGCSCLAGWTGEECNQVCPDVKFGAGCSETCHCASGTCDRFTGRCSDGCESGWGGESCQIPVVCPPNYFGANCTEKRHCETSDAVSGCASHPCSDGYWGEQCNQECQCVDCDKSTGCADTGCSPGYWGANCGMECHCLNAAACDLETGKCVADVSTGLRLCEPGYVSDSGINLDNCQKYEGCYDNCNKTCHCRGGSMACDVSSGVCSDDLCINGWVGSSCQTGIVSLTYTKTNPGQPVQVRCIVTGNPDVPRPNEVILGFDDGTGGSGEGIQEQVTEHAQFLAVVFNASPPIETEVHCLVVIMEGGNTVHAQATITPTFFELPRLSQAPTVTDINSTSVMLQWDAWNPDVGDTGDGPIIGYKIYIINNMTKVQNSAVFVDANITQSTYSAIIGELYPDTEYVMFVNVIREGEGGEGLPSPVAVVTTSLALVTMPTTIATETASLATTEQTTQIPTTVQFSPTTGASPTPFGLTLSVVSVRETNVTLKIRDTNFNTTSEYEIKYRAIEKLYEINFSSGEYTSILANETVLTINNLEPSTLYEFIVTAIGDDDSKIATLQVYTQGASDLPEPEIPKLVVSSSSTVTIKFAPVVSKYFVYYKIGIIKGSSRTKREEPNFDDNSNAYIAAQIGKFNHSGTFTVGDGKMYGGYQNLPLEADKEYMIFIGASSGFDEEEHIEWSSEPLTVITPTSPDDPEGVGDPLFFVIMGGIGVAVLAVVIIIIAIACWASNRGSKKKDTSGEIGMIERRFEINQAYEEEEDDHRYENHDVEYEKAVSSKLDIDWKDMKFSGQKLGEGHYGEVHLGTVRFEDKWLKAAIKSLKDGIPDEERKLFKEEFETMKKIGHHPNVVNILGSCVHKETFYVVLEYVPHGDLRNYLRNSRKTSKGDIVSDIKPTQLLKFAFGVAKAMTHISDLGIIHRDLAARNILLGNGLIPKVSDFGLSRGFEEYIQISDRRVPTRWLALESLTRRTYTSKSDVWSFGILLWEIATFGGTPYSDTETMHLVKLLTGGYRMPQPPNCQDDMYNLMMACWSEDPDERPTFSDIMDVLHGMQAQKRVYMSTHSYKNFQFATIMRERDDN